MDPSRRPRSLLNLHVRDMASAVPFYAHMLSARTVPGDTPGSVRFERTRADGSLSVPLTIEPGDPAGDFGWPHSPVMEMQVDDVAETVADLVAWGATVRVMLEPPPGRDASWTPYAQIDDPFGHRWALQRFEPEEE